MINTEQAKEKSEREKVEDKFVHYTPVLWEEKMGHVHLTAKVLIVEVVIGC